MITRLRNLFFLSLDHYKTHTNVQSIYCIIFAKAFIFFFIDYFLFVILQHCCGCLVWLLLRPEEQVHTIHVVLPSQQVFPIRDRIQIRPGRQPRSDPSIAYFFLILDPDPVVIRYFQPK